MKGVTVGDLQWHYVHSKFHESRSADADVQIEDLTQAAWWYVCFLLSGRKVLTTICITMSENSLITVLSVANAVITLLLKH